MESNRNAFLQLGKNDRAMDYYRLDANSEWGRAHLPAILLREGKIDEAGQAIKDVPDVRSGSRAFWPNVYGTVRYRIDKTSTRKRRQRYWRCEIPSCCTTRVPSWPFVATRIWQCAY
jgi:hypothetical protein